MENLRSVLTNDSPRGQRFPINIADTHKLACKRGCQRVSGLGVAAFGVRCYLTAPSCAMFATNLCCLGGTVQKTSE